MLSIYEAQKEILNNTNPIKRVEIIPIELGLNRVLSQNVTATFDMPRFDNSAMDGYGIKMEDVGKEVKLIHKELAGDKNLSIQNGETIKIMTGAKVDSSIEAVVPVEFVKVNGDKILIPNDVKNRANIRPQGEEFEKGNVLIKKGDVLDKNKISLLASLGITHIEVFAKPRILVIPTGNEIKNHYENINEVQHFNSSSLYFKFEELADVTILPVVGDEIEEIKSKIDTTYDLIITTGGVSKGDADFTTKAFRESGYDIKFEWIAIKPGKPFGFAVGKNIATLLTGNPLAAIFNYNIFVKPLIRKLAGCSSYYIDYINLRSSNTLKRKAGRDEVIPVNIVYDYILLSSKRGSGMISVTSKSDGIIVIDKSVLEVAGYLKFIDFNKWSETFKEFISE
jgi:molybdopterin molybdotransferase